jgi:hypothetical protein
MTYDKVMNIRLTAEQKAIFQETCRVNAQNPGEVIRSLIVLFVTHQIQLKDFTI